MDIEPGRVVSFHYKVCDPEGKQLESTEGRDAAVYLHGRGNIVPGLEGKMRGKKAGDKFSATITPEHAYGMYDETARKRVPIKHLVRPGKLARGKVVEVNTQRGPARGIVLKVGKFNVDLDFNHPLSGFTLVYEIEVIDVRDASAEEMAHGHAHGPGGVEHGPGA
jgi:FKBP-type peptidyl-prolyl cis-trans isomerase SlyD